MEFENEFESCSEFTSDDMIRIWKGLYYCFWMQDKALLQEELALNISKLLDCLQEQPQQCILFMKTFLITICREWPNIDKWRLDKFMMLMRKFFRRYFEWLAKNDWNQQFLQESLQIWKMNVMSIDDSESPEGVKFHFASLLLDELDGLPVDRISADIVMELLKPYIDLVSLKIR